MNEHELAVMYAQQAYEEAVAKRTDAIVEAVRNDVPMRRVAELANCSREEVRKLTKSISITYALDGDEYELTQDQTRVLAYKAAGFARNAFPGDVKLLNVGDAWLEAAKELDRDLGRVRKGLITDPVPLTRDTAYALHQILRLSYLGGRPNRLTALAETLMEHFGVK